jgi:hypothetical protein
MKKSKKGLDCVSMKRSIQEQISKEMKGMTTKERLAYIKRQVQKSPFADAIPCAGNPNAIRKAGND